MKVKVTYQGNNEILIPATYGVGERIIKSEFILDGKAKNEPAIGAEVEVDIDANGRNEITNEQRAAYVSKQSPQNETPPPQPFFGEIPKPRKPKV